MSRVLFLSVMLLSTCCNSKLENIPVSTIISFEKYFQRFHEKQNEIFNIDKRGEDHMKLSYDSIYNKVKSIYMIFNDLKLLSVSFDVKENKRSFSFELKIIDSRTLPSYVYPENEFKTDLPQEKGYLLYLYDDTFTKSYQFNLIKPISIKDRWYYYAI